MLECSHSRTAGVKALKRLDLSQKVPEVEAESSGVSTQSDDSLDEENQQQDSVAQSAIQETSLNNTENNSVNENQSEVVEVTSVSVNSEPQVETTEAEISAAESISQIAHSDQAESAEISNRSETEAQNDAEIVRETVNGVTTYTINDSMGQREISILAQPETTNQARLKIA